MKLNNKTYEIQEKSKLNRGYISFGPIFGYKC